MDKGPWIVGTDAKGLYSEDFEHDVLLRVDGDFADDAQRKAYCEWLAARLNGQPVQQEGPLTPLEHETRRVDPISEALLKLGTTV